MLLNVIAVDWNKVEALPSNQTIGSAVWQAGKAIQLGNPPWPSDSTIQLGEVYECFEAIRDTLTEPTRSQADRIVTEFMQPSFCLPWELRNFKQEENIIGALSPETVQRALQTFSQIDYEELDEAFDTRLPLEVKKNCQIACYPSQDVFSGYLQQWQNLFQFAAERGAGILFHCG